MNTRIYLFTDNVSIVTRSHDGHVYLKESSIIFGWRNEATAENIENFGGENSNF